MVVYKGEDAYVRGLDARRVIRGAVSELLLSAIMPVISRDANVLGPSNSAVARS